MSNWINLRWASLGMLPQFQLGKFENPCKLHPPVECWMPVLEIPTETLEPHWRYPQRIPQRYFHYTPAQTSQTFHAWPSWLLHSLNILLSDSICPPNLLLNFRGLWKSKDWTWKSWPIDIDPFDPPVPPKEIVGCLWSYFTWKALRALCCGIQTRSAWLNIMIGEIHDLPPGYWIPTQGGTCFWTKEKQKRCSFVRNPCPAWPAHGPSKMQRLLHAWGKQAVSRQWIWTKMLKTLRKDKQTC